MNIVCLFTKLTGLSCYNQEAAALLKPPESHAEMEMNRQIPMPNNLEPQQSPENTVIKKPEIAAAVREERREEVGPMNPIQEQAAPPVQVCCS